jgi:hypothetical protein
MSGPQGPDPQYPHYPQYPAYAQYPPQPHSAGYPPPQFGQPYRQSFPPQQPPRATIWQRLGARATHRPAPRFGVTLTGVGIALVVVGIVVWGITYLAEGAQSSSFAGTGSGSDSRRFLGFILALIVVAVGYALVVVVRTGPLVTAGIAATALGIPVAIEFLTVSDNGTPTNFDAVTWVSVIAYLISYLFVRGARGHTIYLGLALLFLWEYALSKAAPSLSSVESSFLQTFNGTGDTSVSFDTTTVAGVSLVFGIAYYLIAWSLDHTGRAGVALPFVVVAIPATLGGILAFAPDAEQIGTGIMLLIVGLLLCRYGARYGRRFTAWFWGLVSGAGAVTILSKFATDGASVGISMIAIGVVFVLGGWLLAQRLREPDDMVQLPPQG